MRERPELELIADCRRGDKAAMTELFGRHYPTCLRLARGILRSDEESQDAVQSAYFSAFRHFHNFRGDAAFKTWISRIVMNQCLMLLREPRHRLNWVSLDDPDKCTSAIALVSSAPTPEKSALSREVASALSDAIGCLPKHMREIFTLCAVSGFSVKEAAAELGVTVAAAKTRLFRAHVQMRSRLKPMWTERRDVAA
jgi:RNA polymerase sigma-70 factor (ECF subfamily)